MRGHRSFLVGLARTFIVSAWAALLSIWAYEPCCEGASLNLMNEAQPGMPGFAGISESSVWTLGDRGEPILVLHVVLAELGYLPCSYHVAVPTDRLYPQDWARAPIGYWTWNSGVPSELARRWDPDRYTEITKGAVMRFEADHGLRVDGYTGPRVRRTLELALALHLTATQPYRLVMVDQSIPQQLRVWEDGRGVIFQTVCSTGVSAAPTQPGAHAIFLRSREQTMQGIGPSGHPYRVEHVPYVSFFYGEQAIHGFPRRTYGQPQSAGCVELPIQAAKRVWDLTNYGTLVLISPLTLSGTQ